MICSDHGSQNDNTHVTVSTAQINGVDESDCCPIVGTPASLLPERPLLSVQATGDYQGLASASTQLWDEVPIYYGRAEIPSKSSGPPLERLCILRI